MLDKKELISQSLIMNLYYLRSMKEYALNIEISFVSKDQQVITDAGSFREHFDRLLEDTVKLSDGNISQDLLDSDIFFTEYTSKCERLTEELLAININNQITRHEEAMTAGTVEVTDELLNGVRTVNKKANTIIQNFITYTQSILDNTTKNKLFSYSYPTLLKKIHDDTTIYQKELSRLIDEESFTPTSAYQNECCLNRSNEMNAMFIRSFIDPKDNGVFKEADSFVTEFHNANLKDQQLSPDTQYDLTNERLELMRRFKEFVNKVIEGMLNSTYYLIIEPIFLDNILTEANFYILILEENLKNI